MCNVLLDPTDSSNDSTSLCEGAADTRSYVDVDEREAARGVAEALQYRYIYPCAGKRARSCNMFKLAIIPAQPRKGRYATWWMSERRKSNVSAYELQNSLVHIVVPKNSSPESVYASKMKHNVKAVEQNNSGQPSPPPATPATPLQSSPFSRRSRPSTLRSSYPTSSSNRHSGLLARVQCLSDDEPCPIPSTMPLSCPRP